MDSLNGIYGVPKRAILYGEGVFETFRWKGGRPVLLDKHYERMLRGAELLGMPAPPWRDFTRAVEEAVHRSGGEDLRVKVCLLSDGSADFSARPDSSRLICLTSPYRTPKEIVRVHLVSFPRNSRSPLVRIKSTNYLENIIGRREAERLGFDEGIFLNERGEVAEGCTTNIFWLKGDRLFTPDESCGLLPGTTRGLLMSIAPELGLEVGVGKYGFDDVLEADCVLLTNAVVGAVGVGEIDGRKLMVDRQKLEEVRRRVFSALGW
jgi:branched-subunit amino acid aminotransferase/4-amino-4-deoxychorismate lyase